MDKAMYITNKNGAVLTKLRERDGISECYIENKQNGESTLSFSMLTSSEKYEFLSNAENLVVADGKVYTQLYDGDSFNEKKDTSNKNSVQINLVELQYLLGKAYITAYNSTTTYDHIDNTMVVILSGGIDPLTVNGEEIENPYEKGSAAYALYTLLYGSGWTVGVVDVVGKFDLESEKKSILENIKAVQALWGGILIFDSLQKVVSLRAEEAYQPYNGYGIRYRFNETGLERNINKNIVTRLYVYGKEGLNIASSNDGKEYLEDYSYTSTPLYGLIENNDISNVGDLIVWGKRELKKLSTPQVTLKISLIDRSLLEGNGVSFSVSDMVDVVDEDLSDNKYRARVTAKKYDFFRPWICSAVTLGDEKEVFAAKIKYALTSADKVNNLIDLMGKVSAGDVMMNGEDGTRQTMESYVQLTNQALEAGFKVIGVDGYERTGKTTISADGIEVYNGGVVIRDRQNNVRIYMDGATGNIIFSGDLYGASGTFSGELEAATGTFSGELKAAKGSFEGDITAKSGYIGSWQILEGGIINKNNSLALTKDGGIVASSGSFAVYPSGELYAKGATINGSFSAATENSSIVFSEDTMLISWINKDNEGNIGTCCKISPTEFYFYTYDNGKISTGIHYSRGNLELINPVDENGDEYPTMSEVVAEIERYITDSEASIKMYVQGQKYLTYEEVDKKYLKQVDLYAGIETYINTEEGRSLITSACSGTYVTKTEAEDYLKEIDVKNIIEQEVTEMGGSIRMFIEGKNYLTKKDGESTYVSKVDLNAGINSYINTEEGTAGIISACSGTYVTEDEAQGFVQEIEVKNIIAQEISEKGGSIKAYVEGKNYITKDDGENVFVSKTNLYSGIESYINTEEGTASITSACSGTYFTKDEALGLVRESDVKNIISQEMTDSTGSIRSFVEGKMYLTRQDAENTYTKQTELYSGIANYINTTEGTACIISACKGTFQFASDMDKYSLIKDVEASITQAISDNEASIKLFVSNTYQSISDMADYSTTLETQSLIDVSLEGITLSTSSSVSGNTTTSTLTLKKGSLTLSSAKISIESITKDYAAKIAADAVNGITLSTSTTVSGNQTESTFTLKNGTAIIDTASVIGTTATQAAKIAADAVNGITLSTSTTVSGNQTESTFTLKNGTAIIDTASVIGTTATQAAKIAADAVNGITLSVTNGKDTSTLTIKSGSTTITSGEIKFTGTVTFDDLKTKGSTIINGSNITTGKISADYIDVDNLYVEKIGNSSKRAIIDCSKSDYLYIGGSSTTNSVSNIEIHANKITFGSWSGAGNMCLDASAINSSFYSTGYSASLGNSSNPWNAYFKELHIMVGSSEYITGKTTTSSYEFGPYSSSRTCNLGSSTTRWDTGYFKNLNIGSGGIRLGDGTSAKLGFFGTTPVARQTVSDSATVATLIKALKSYGLIS
ncbi:MAG: phage tail protein [Oscillospiraceae bacterium]